MVGAIPTRHRAEFDRDELDGYFAMARGTQELPPLEMTNWFDTNYHYLVPELGPDTVLRADSGKQVRWLRVDFTGPPSDRSRRQPNHAPPAPTSEQVGSTPAPTQSLTSRPVKGMLTGRSRCSPGRSSATTNLAPRPRQVALALRDEVTDLEAAGSAIIQVDEPALRETLPLRHADRAAYLAWATEPFRLTTIGVRPDTQIHTHMCYVEFGDILTALDDMDADVASLEAARSHMQVATELADAGYPREVVPGCTTSIRRGCPVWRR